MLDSLPTFTNTEWFGVEGENELRSGNLQSQFPGVDGSKVAEPGDFKKPQSEGGRNNAIASFVGFQIREGAARDQIIDRCRELNSTYKPPLPDSEVLTTIDSVIRSAKEEVPLKASVKRGENVFSITCADSVAMERVQFLWPDRIPKKIVVIAGDPGKGKSQITMYIAATVSNGGRWFDGTPCDQGAVLVIACEDGRGDTMKPRLVAAGGNPKNVYFLDWVKDGAGIKREFDLGLAEHLRDILKQHPTISLIIIDPVSAYLAGSDGHSNSDVRGLLKALDKLTEEFSVCILLVTHFNKNSQGDPMTRIIGSQAFTAGPRAVYVAGEHPEDENLRCLLTLKANILKFPPGLTYSIEQAEVSDSGNPPVHVTTSRVSWEGTNDLQAADLFGMNQNKTKSEVMQCGDEIIAQLKKAEGKRLPSKKLEKVVCQDFSPATFKRAFRQLKSKGITSRKRDEKKWFAVLEKDVFFQGDQGAQ